MGTDKTNPAAPAAQPAAGPATATVLGEPPGSPPRTGARRRQLRWFVPLAVVCVAFVAFSVPPYLTFDPSQSRLPGTRDGFPLYYPLLVTHIVFGSVALLAGCLQVWPWFRRHHPAAHRMIGRVYLFGGVLPAGIAVLGVAPLSSTGFVSQVGNTFLALLWLPTTIAGYRMARQRRFAEHREWMIRSFALTTSIVVNRVWVILLVVVLSPQVDTTFGGDQDAMITAAANASVWLSWVVNLLVAEWWLQRGRARALRQPA
ncbi:MAG TPA: DUF2306 domain-containing protein, partial [Pseudonocardiaceae bacterium]|nr:DUF2306 domain-containing protein [Pseudonocardiaceae bacterium]